MSTTTTNFGWTVPQSTDLVKDGATAIATLGSGIDTTMVDLKGGTTGQVLSKTTNTDMDFTWVTPQVGDITAVTAGTGISGGGTGGDVTITNSMATAIDAKGDLVAGTGADAFARLAVGTNGQLLTADSTQATGLSWTSPAGAAKNWTLLSSTSLSGAATITISGISGKDSIMIFIRTASSVNASSNINIRLNTDSGANYNYGGFYYASNSTYSATTPTGTFTINDTSFPIAVMNNAASDQVGGSMVITGANGTSLKQVTAFGAPNSAAGNGGTTYAYNGFYAGTSAITSVSAVSLSGNFDLGTLYVYTSTN